MAADVPPFMRAIPLHFFPNGGRALAEWGPPPVELRPGLTRIPELPERPKNFRRPPIKSIPHPIPLPPAELQLLVPDDVSPNLEEGLEARVKDPLWFLARQWQTGEFEAENGGTLAQIEVTTRAIPMTRIVRGPSDAPLDPAAPLEWAVEAELPDGSAPAWVAARLEYRFALTAGTTRLEAEEYDGKSLDWYHFDLQQEGTTPAALTEEVTRVLPHPLRTGGMPHPRWWRFETGDVDVTRLVSPQPNVLQMLLGEFALIDSNNWYVAPVEHPVGHLQHVSRVRAVDVFGVAREIPATIDRWGTGAWEVFTLSGVRSGRFDGSYLFVPNTVDNLMDGEALEEIDFIRDENANIVWAVERHYADAVGTRIDRGDEAARATPTSAGLAMPAMLDAAAQAMPVFRLASVVGRHWIPYVPRLAPRTAGGTDVEMFLRRARSDEAASRANPQHRTRIVAEAWRLEESEIPRTGLRVQRLQRFARGSDGAARVWTGRRKDVNAVERTASLDFDFVQNEVQP